MKPYPIFSLCLALFASRLCAGPVVSTDVLDYPPPFVPATHDELVRLGAEPSSQVVVPPAVLLQLDSNPYLASMPRVDSATTPAVPLPPAVASVVALGTCGLVYRVARRRPAFHTRRMF